jgi:hypothetical protein
MLRRDVGAGKPVKLREAGEESKQQRAEAKGREISMI